MPNEEIIHCESVTTSGYVSFLQRTSADIIDMGFGAPYDWPINFDDEVLIVKHDNIPVACMVFRWIEWKKQFFLPHTFVLPDYRRRGIYTRMYARLKEIAASKKAINIVSGVHVNNKIMQDCSERNGRIRMGILYEDRGFSDR